MMRKTTFVNKERAMDAIQFLESQHREVEDLFAQIEKLSEGSGREKKTLFNEVASKLENHAKIEEKIFYPEGRQADEDITLESYVEHDLVKLLIRNIKKTSPRDESFMAKITVLKEMVEHHVKEEEQVYFPECKKQLGQDKIEELGTKLEQAFERLESRKMPRRPTRKAA